MAIKPWTDPRPWETPDADSRQVPALDQALGQPKELKPAQECATYDCKVWSSKTIIMPRIAKSAGRARWPSGRAQPMLTARKAPSSGPAIDWTAYQVCSDCAHNYVADDGAVIVGGLEDYERIQEFYAKLRPEGADADK